MFKRFIHLLHLIVIAASHLTAYNAHAAGLYVCGSIRDAFTNGGIEDSFITILKPDSTVVTSGYAHIPAIRHDLGNGSIRQEKDNTQGATFQLEIPEEGEYLISVSMLGYEPECRKISLEQPKRNRPVTIDDIYLIPKATELDQLTVTGTKLKVYHKGDTLVYDANAFVMDKHNVLEDLVKRLPGVEFRDGKVFVNGRFVDNIVIGGKDFLKNDPQQLMAMLPAYVVDKLKFYDKSGEQSKTMGKDMHDSSYVMDITMKRDYHGSWLGNLNIGAGTEKRWGGIGFAMRFDDRQALSLSIDANNLGLTRMATDLCTDIEDRSDFEDSRNLQADLGYSYHPSDKLRVDAHAKVSKINKKEGTDEIFTSNPGLNEQIKRQSSNDSDLSRLSFSGDAGITLRPKKGIFGQLDYLIEHTNEDMEDSSVSLTGYADAEWPDSIFDNPLLFELPSSLHLKDISNAYRNFSTSDFNSWLHKASASSHIAIDDNLLRISASLKADDRRRMRHRDYIYRIFSEEDEGERSLSLFDTHILNYRTDAALDFDINYADNSAVRGILTPFYRFGWFKENDDRLMYDYPTAYRSPQGNLNTDNSRWISGNARRHTVGVTLKHEFHIGKSERWMMLYAKMTADFEQKGIDCSFSDITNRTNHHFFLLNPEISIRWHPVSGDRRGSKASLELKCRMSQDSPTTNDLAEYTDTSDPMNIFTGNPTLLKQTKLESSLEIKRYFGKSRSNLYATLRNINIWDGISLKSIYDMTTGIRTIMPVNSTAGRETSLDLGYGLPVYKQSWWLNLAARGSLTRCADLSVYADSPDNEPYMDLGSYLTRVTIRHNAPSGKVMASYTATYQGSMIAGSSEIGSHIRSLSQNLMMELQLPAAISFSANCNIISRFGYALPSLDRTIFLLNASIEKSFLNDKFNLKLSAVDLLRQRKNVFTVIDGTGSTETLRTRFIPSYVMLSVYYQWSHSPKKK